LFKIFANAWRVDDIRKKILFILLLLLIYRFGAVIPLPGIDLDMLYLARGGGGGLDWDPVMTMLSVLMGGDVGSIFVMGIGPYITASIIMQLLTYAIPQLSAMQKEGEDGRKKSNKSHVTWLLCLLLFKEPHWCFPTPYGLRVHPHRPTSSAMGIKIYLYTQLQPSP